MWLLNNGEISFVSYVASLKFQQKIKYLFYSFSITRSLTVTNVIAPYPYFRNTIIEFRYQLYHDWPYGLGMNHKGVQTESFKSFLYGKSTHFDWNSAITVWCRYFL